MSGNDGGDTMADFDKFYPEVDKIKEASCHTSSQLNDKLAFWLQEPKSPYSKYCLSGSQQNLTTFFQLKQIQITFGN